MYGLKQSIVFLFFFNQTGMWFKAVNFFFNQADICFKAAKYFLTRLVYGLKQSVIFFNQGQDS